MRKPTDKQTSLKNQFEASDWAEFKSVAGNADAFKSIQDVEKWANDANRNLANFIAQNRAGMIDKTILHVSEERNKQEPGLEPPYPKKTIEQEAKERVHLDIEARFADITQEKQDRIIAITGASRTGPQAASQNDVDHLAKFENQAANAKPTDSNASMRQLEKEVISTFHRSGRLRKNLDYEFRQNRKQLFEQAETNGTEKPGRAFYQAHEKQINALNQASAKQIHQSFTDHSARMNSPQSPQPIAPEQSQSGPKQ